ncbi:MAG: magnesium transporter CorA family protein, partial [Actinobacteria bacterium]|nr:magnesium transporter CorA family protein [Actinomycetota bacterium]
MTSAPDHPTQPTMRDAVRTRVWRNGTLELEDFPFEQISDYLEQSDCLVWADVCDPSPERIQALAEELSLDPHAVEDATATHERPKATRFATHLFITAYSARLVSNTDDMDGEVAATHVSAFVVPRGVFTVRLDGGFDIEQVVRRWDDNDDLMKYGPRALVHGLLDVMVDQYFETIEDLDEQVESLEDILFEETRNSGTEIQRRTFALRKSLAHTRKVILPMREVVNTVMRRVAEEDEHNELTPYYEDLYDHVLRAGEWTESLRDMISSVFETNLSLADARLNGIMKKLTSWAAIIAVPTAVTGYFGQNVP